MTELKKCTKCGSSKPKTLEYFGKERTCLRAECRSCQNLARSNRRKNNPDRYKCDPYLYVLHVGLAYYIGVSVRADRAKNHRAGFTGGVNKSLYRTEHYTGPDCLRFERIQHSEPLSEGMLIDMFKDDPLCLNTRAGTTEMIPANC